MHYTLQFMDADNHWQKWLIEPEEFNNIHDLLLIYAREPCFEVSLTTPDQATPHRWVQEANRKELLYRLFRSAKLMPSDLDSDPS